MTKETRRSMLAVCMAGLLVGSALDCNAAEKRKTMPTVEQASNPVEVAILSARLAAYGDEQNDPLALLVAAKMMRGVSGDASPKSYVGRWLDQAQSLAANRADLLALIEDVRAAGSRGVIGGFSQQPDNIRGDQAKTYSFAFDSTSTAAVGLALQPDQDRSKVDLDLYVTDDRGAEICASEGSGMPELCRWTPKRTGKFQVKVQNRLGTPADFVLFVR